MPNVFEEVLGALKEAQPWVHKLAADAPEAMVGRGAILQRSLKRIDAAIAAGEELRSAQAEGIASLKEDISKLEEALDAVVSGHSPYACNCECSAALLD